MSLTTDSLHSPEPFLTMARAYQQSRVLLTAAQLDVFTWLGAESLSAAALAEKAGLDPRALAALLDCLVGLRILTKREGCYSNTGASLEFLTRDAKGSILPALAHSANQWERWSTLTEVVRTGAPVRHKEIGQREDGWIQDFIGAMAVFSRKRAPVMATAVGLQGVARMLDVGGGPGTYAIAFAQAAPALKAVVFDLPNVLPLAEKNIAAAGLSDRITAEPGDYHTSPFPGMFDLILLSSIVHINSDAENRQLLRRLGEALLPGGRIVIQDHVMSDDHTQPLPGTLFAINMLVGTARGGTYARSEMEAWLTEAGCKTFELLELPGNLTLLIGQKPR